MNINPLVSVTICSFNAQKYIEQTINSVINQTYHNIEIIIVDDGSTDNTKSILLKAQKKDERIKIFFEEHGGLAAARNKSFKYVSGEWIAIIDCDDLCYPNRIEEQLKLAQRYPDAGVIFCNTDHVDEKGDFIKKHLINIKLPDFIKKKYVSNLLLQKGCFIDSEAFFGKRELLLQIPGLDSNLKYTVDYDFFIRLGLITNFAYTPLTLSGWRIHPNQATNYYSNIIDKELIKIYSEYLFNKDIYVSTKIILFLKIIKSIYKILKIKFKSKVTNDKN